MLRTFLQAMFLHAFSAICFIFDAARSFRGMVRTLPQALFLQALSAICFVFDAARSFRGSVFTTCLSHWLCY